MTIKKQYLELIALLEANKNKNVATIMPEVLALVTSKQKQTILRDDEGTVTDIFCYYHKEWESVELYGKKASSASGFNTMCKQGTNQWSKQQREAKKAKDALLQAMVNDNTINLTEALDEIEATRTAVIPRT